MKLEAGPAIPVNEVPVDFIGYFKQAETAKNNTLSLFIYLFIFKQESMTKNEGIFSIVLLFLQSQF